MWIWHFAWYLDGPAVVSVNIFVRSISKIDDVTMVSRHRDRLGRASGLFCNTDEEGFSTSQMKRARMFFKYFSSVDWNTFVYLFFFILYFIMYLLFQQHLIGVDDQNRFITRANSEDNWMNQYLIFFASRRLIIRYL